MLANRPWPKFNCDLGNTGLSPFPLANNAGREAWRYDFEGRFAPGTPVIGPDDTIFVSVNRESASRTDVFALNPEGLLQWETTVDMWVHGREAVDAEGRLYLPCRGRDEKVRSLIALNSDGSERWRTPLPHFNFTGCTITESGIYLGVGRQAICYDFDGEQKWVTRLGVEVGDDRVSPPITPDEKLLFAPIPVLRRQRAAVIAVSLNGSLAWKTEFGTCRFTEVFAEVMDYPWVMPDGRICVQVRHELIGDVGSTARILSGDGDVLQRLRVRIEGVGPDGTLFAFAPVGRTGGDRLYLGRYDDYCDFENPAEWKLQRLTADLQPMWERPLGFGPTMLCTSGDGCAIIRSEPHGPKNEIHTPKPKEIHAMSPDGNALWTLREPKASLVDAIVGRDGVVYVTSIDPPTLRAIA